MRLRRHGFSLLEILVVVLIISMLAVLITPRIVAHLRKAKVGIAQTKLAKVGMAVGEFYHDCGRLPTEGEWPGAMQEAPTDVAVRWHGPYLSEGDLKDPWGQMIQYRRSGSTFEVLSLGADGKRGGEGENADIAAE